MKNTESKSKTGGKGCLITIAVILGILIILYLFGSTESVQWDNVIKNDNIRTYKSFVKQFPNGSHTQEAKIQLNKLISIADSLWIQCLSYPSDSLLFLYLTKYSSSESKSAKYFIKSKDIFGHPMEKEYLAGLQSSDPVTREFYASRIGDEGEKAILYTPYLINLLDDYTALQISSGPAVGPKTKIGTTSVANSAHSALIRITKQKFGVDKYQWSKWWEEWWIKNRDQFR